MAFRVFSAELLTAFGASRNTLPFALEYMNVYVYGTIFIQVTLCLNSFITAQGFNRVSMTTVLIGAVSNIVLDPIFIFALNMGVRGAALATVISQGISAVFAFQFLIGKKAVLRITLKNMISINWRLVLGCLALGLSPFVMSITETALAACFNTSLLGYGGDLAVGSMAVFNTIMQLAAIPVHGLAMGAQPITSYNFGAKRWDRVSESFRILLTSALTFAAIMWLLVMLFPTMFIRIFTSDPALVEYAPGYLRVFMAVSFIMSIQTSCQMTFLSLGNAKVSLFLALLRKIILLIPMIYILPIFFENKVFSVFLAEPVSDAIAALATLTLFIVTYKGKIAFRRNKCTEE